MYRPNFYESTCLRCNETVYQVDRVGPLKDFTFFHSGCFKCAVCGTKLTLKTYYNNQHRQEDKEVYCNSHVPKIGPGHLDGSSVGIRSALNVPRSTNFVNEQIRGPSRTSDEGKDILVIILLTFLKPTAVIIGIIHITIINSKHAFLHQLPPFAKLSIPQNTTVCTMGTW